MVPAKYRVTEKSLKNVNNFWKILHISVFILIALVGFSATFLFGKASTGFSFNCILYANITFKSITNTTVGVPDSSFFIDNSLPVIDFKNTTWGSISSCNYCQFTPLIAMLAAIIWTIYFFILSHGGAGEVTDPIPQPWKIVVPAVIFSILMLIPIGVACGISATGYSEFCANFEDDLGKPCSETVDFYTKQFSGEVSPFHMYYNGYSVCLNLLFSLWCSQLLLLILRMVFSVDFHVVKIAEPKDTNKSDRNSIGEDTLMEDSD